MTINYHIHFPYGNELPKKIYKYVSFEEHHMRSLICNDLYFSDPHSFNDPYEPFILFDGDSRFGVTIKANLEKSAITCFSTSPDNFTLWSYYANGMKGFCIEYDTEILLNSLLSKLEIGQWIYSFDAHYLDKEETNFGVIPVVNEDALLSSDYDIKGPELVKIFSTKPSIFSNENEVRLVIQPSGRLGEMEPMAGLYQHSRESITGVIYSDKTSEKDVEIVKTILGDNVSYRKSRVEGNSFRIIVE